MTGHPCHELRARQRLRIGVGDRARPFEGRGLRRHARDDQRTHAHGRAIALTGGIRSAADGSKRAAACADAPASPLVQGPEPRLLIEAVRIDASGEQPRQLRVVGH